MAPSAGSLFSVLCYVTFCFLVTTVLAKPCNLTEYDHGCGDNEICVENRNATTEEGTCQCLPTFHRDESGECVTDYKPPTPGSSTSTVTIVLACLIPICLLLLCGVAVFVAVKLRLVQRLRQRCQNVRTYEVVSIGNDDDEPLVVWGKGTLTHTKPTNRSIRHVPYSFFSSNFIFYVVNVFLVKTKCER